MSGGAILGCGGHRPSRRVTSEALSVELDTTPAALVACSGVQERRYAADGEGSSDLGCVASRAALEAAGLGPSDVELIIFATMTPDITFPGPGCFLQHKLACRTIGALDVRAQCAGFLFALMTADQFVAGRGTGPILVVGGEVHSAGLDFSPRGAEVTPFFGDGAGALVLGAGDRPGVLAGVLRSDPTDLERFWCEFPASRHYPARMDVEALRAGRHFMELRTSGLHHQAEEALVATARGALAEAGVSADHVALALVHYLDPRVARRAAGVVGFAEERTVATAEAGGHVAAGGVPLALAEAIEAGRVGPGDVVCCSAFGAGMAWGSVVLRL